MLLVIVAGPPDAVITDWASWAVVTVRVPITARALPPTIAASIRAAGEVCWVVLDMRHLLVFAEQLVRVELMLLLFATGGDQFGPT
ncbi:hypothetical protein GCM10009856_36450 [Mycolicibacterium llatzerense]